MKRIASGNTTTGNNIFAAQVYAKLDGTNDYVDLNAKLQVLESKTVRLVIMLRLMSLNVAAEHNITIRLHNASTANASKWHFPRQNFNLEVAKGSYQIPIIIYFTPYSDITTCLYMTVQSDNADDTNVNISAETYHDEATDFNNFVIAKNIPVFAWI